MSNEDFDLLVSNLSARRLYPYLYSMNGNKAQAAALYRWNIYVSAALFEILSVVEVALRNSIDIKIQEYLPLDDDQDSWLLTHSSFLSSDRHGDIEKARRSLQIQNKTISHDNLVSQLGFGFWSYLLIGRYRDTLWRTSLRFAFPHSPSRQPEYIFTRVRHLHVLRNRIAHHEPIHRRDIARDFQICIEVLYAISPAIAQWSAENSRVLAVLAEKPLNLV